MKPDMTKRSYPSQKHYPYSDAQHIQWLFEIDPYTLTRRQRIYNRYIKRVLDCVLAGIGLIVLSPLYAVLALKIRRDSSGPILFRQLRVGQQGESFTILKFRTMSTQAPEAVSTHSLCDAAQYITPLGAKLRATSLDELPQLWNVLKGEMALVGPRPLIRQEEDVNFLRRRNGIYQLKPGITGWAQVKGRDFVTVGEKISYDRDYLQGLSLGLDLKILCLTVRSVFKKDEVAF